MKYLPVMLMLSFLLPTISFAQNNTLEKKIGKLSQVSNIPFSNCDKTYDDCGDELIWQIVRYDKKAILPLIEKLGDSSWSNAYYKEGNKEYRLHTSVIAYITLNQVLAVPLASLSGMQFDVLVCGWYPHGMLAYLNNTSNMKKMKLAIENYYRNTPLMRVAIKKDKLNHCASDHGIDGYYDREKR